jgi:serine/threonine protein kinase
LAFEPTDAPAAANTFQTMSLGGTPQYSSPEQLMEQTLTSQSDLWSLAVTMYQCLSGRLPFGEQPMVAVGKILSRDRDPPPDLVETSYGRVAPEVASIISKAMAFDPNDRFISATAMADAIRDALSDYDVFISYRREHKEYGRKIKDELSKHGLKAFLDVDPEDGLTLGPFQAQLERVLLHTPTVFMLITPSPSGPDQSATGGIDRSVLSSMDNVAAYLKLGWTDYCEVEMKRSLELHKQIVPIYSKSWNGEAYIGTELGKIGHLDSVKQLRSLNAFDVDVSDVTPGVERIVQHLRKYNLDWSKMSSQEKLKERDEKLLLKAKLIGEQRKQEEKRLRREEEERQREIERRKKEEEERNYKIYIVCFKTLKLNQLQFQFQP